MTTYDFNFQGRMDAMRKTREKQTRAKQETYGTGGYWDMDDKGMVLPPPGFTFTPESNHEDGNFYGNVLCGRNYRRLLETHPVCIDPMSSLAGGWMVDFYNIKKPRWNPDYSYAHLQEEQRKYDLVHGIGGIQHFNVDFAHGLELGFPGLLDKVLRYEKTNGDPDAFYQAEKDVLLGMMDMIRRHAESAGEMARTEKREEIRRNLLAMEETNLRLLEGPPGNFLEAVQWVAWYVMFAVMYNFSGAGGAIDGYLYPYYLKSRQEEGLSDDEAIFHLACLLMKDNQYYEIGGTHVDGRDRCNELSFFMIEAAHRIKVPTSICVRVHDRMNKDLLRLSVRYLFQDQLGTPSFIGHKAVTEGFMRNGYSIEQARTRAKTGCHWCALPGEEYTLNDVVKISFLALFDVAFQEMIDNGPSVEKLWDSFVHHMGKAVSVIAQGMDFHLEHMHKVVPELVLNLLCHGPIERGRDITHGGVDHYNLCLDGAGLATVADSFAAMEQRIEQEKKITWEQLKHLIETDFRDAEPMRLMLRNIPRYGTGNTRADAYAQKITTAFTRCVKENKTPGGRNMIPGLFSWANTIPFGKAIGASPNGRKAHQAISHGANPEPGFSRNDTPTAMANAVASNQCGYGNTSPLQLELDPRVGIEQGGVELVTSFIEAFCESGGTLLNINILDKEKILDAHRNPADYPGLIVRVTGFSAYFASLSEEFRQLVVDRIVEGI
ncbi:MAG: pyruvate formate lyase family protein [Clostridia bacterium]